MVNKTTTKGHLILDNPTRAMLDADLAEAMDWHIPQEEPHIVLVVYPHGPGYSKPPRAYTLTDVARLHPNLGQYFQDLAGSRRKFSGASIPRTSIAETTTYWNDMAQDYYHSTGPGRAGNQCFQVKSWEGFHVKDNERLSVIVQFSAYNVYTLACGLRCSFSSTSHTLRTSIARMDDDYPDWHAKMTVATGLNLTSAETAAFILGNHQPLNAEKQCVLADTLAL